MSLPDAVCPSPNGLVHCVVLYSRQLANPFFKMATTQEEMSKLMANVTPWYRDPGRRKLYALLLIALVSAATNGYDGSLMNGVQSITYYENCTAFQTS